EYAGNDFQLPGRIGIIQPTNTKLFDQGKFLLLVVINQDAGGFWAMNQLTLQNWCLGCLMKKAMAQADFFNLNKSPIQKFPRFYTKIAFIVRSLFNNIHKLRTDEILTFPSYLRFL